MLQEFMIDASFVRAKNCFKSIMFAFFIIHHKSLSIEVFLRLIQIVQQKKNMCLCIKQDMQSSLIFFYHCKNIRYHICGVYTKVYFMYASTLYIFLFFIKFRKFWRLLQEQYSVNMHTTLLQLQCIKIKTLKNFSSIFNSYV